MRMTTLRERIVADVREIVTSWMTEEDALKMFEELSAVPGLRPHATAFKELIEDGARP